MRTIFIFACSSSLLVFVKCARRVGDSGFYSRGSCSGALRRPSQEKLMTQLNATYRSIEESIGRLLPKQTKDQLSLMEALVR